MTKGKSYRPGWQGKGYTANHFKKVHKRKVALYKETRKEEAKDVSRR